MLPTNFATINVRGETSDAPTLIAQVDSRPKRVVVRRGEEGGGGTQSYYTDPNAAQRGAEGTFIGSGAPFNSFVFLLAPYQRLYASGTAVFTPISVSVSEIDPAAFPRGLGVARTTRFRQVPLPIGAQAKPLASAQDYPVRIVVRNTAAPAIGSFAVLNADLANLDAAGRRFGYDLPNGAEDIFVLAPYQTLYGIASGAAVVAPQLSISVNDGLPLDHVLVV